ncbi:MAG: sulfite exporter TauE/SafE family protein [Gemmatimonadaceae bacterium]|nr:sulfite exporter TauE/SafE family protein [Gemmatimonadaceae bacterium]
MALLQLTDISSQLSSSPAAALPLLFGAGVLTSLTPCVYPMIPITAAIVGGQSSSDQTGDTKPSRWRPLGLSLAYVLGLASVYAGLGLLAGLTGTMFGTVSSNPWAYFVMANLLMLAGLAMLDVIPVRVPSAIMQRAANAGTGGRTAGAFVMGAASGLVAAPCSAPVMAAVLTWVSTTKSAGLGFVYLFTFSLGMCTLLLVVGLSAGSLSRLPRAGAWMLTVKKVFAFIMIAMAEYYLVKMGQVYF